VARKLLRVALYVIAGFFFYTGSLLAFVSGVPRGAKWAYVAVVVASAVVALVAGLASGRFRDWRRDAGIVLVSASGFTIFLVFTFACLVLSEDFRRLMQPDAIAFFGDYLSGAAVIACVGITGAWLLRADRRGAERGPT